MKLKPKPKPKPKLKPTRRVGVRLKRRQFLQSLGAAGIATATGGLGLLTGRARALGPQQKVKLMRVRYKGSWNVNLGAGRTLGEEIRLRTSLDMHEEVQTVDLNSPRLFDSLFALFVGDGPFTLTESERQNLKRWMGLGGFIVFDNAGASGMSLSFDQSVRRELGLLFPSSKIARVSPEHVLFRSFYRLDYPAGLAINKPYLEGVTIGRRYSCVINHNNLTGAAARDGFGSYKATPSPGGENQREMAFRFGVNLMMYSSCLHYKDDQVHLDFLLHRRKWKIEPPK